ncbi:MAG TPA: regulatory protein RecX [Mobilitalea sp.]|nr:regulatory protein RecX [Mobilitalea sp.]
MIVTRLEELEQSKVKVYIDYEYAFLLYQKDITQFKLREGDLITQAVYEDIVSNTVYYRARQKALSILKSIDRTEQELRKKLSDAGYTNDIIDKTISYISGYGYLNDERLASAYVRARKNTKSKLVIKNELLQKGVKKEIIDFVFDEAYDNEEQEDSELIAIKKAIAKKVKDPGNLDYDEKQKLIASLYRKGFDISKIKQILDNFYK